MRRSWKAQLAGTVALATFLGAVPPLRAHDVHRLKYAQAKVALSSFLSESASAQGRTSGQGAMRFRVLSTAGALPAPALKVLAAAHGGFAVDLRAGRGETYFALPGIGILQISSDLKRIQVLGTPPEMKDVNLHSTSIWQAPDGTPYLVFAANDAGKVFTTTLDGRLVATLNIPDSHDDFDVPRVNQYFAGGGNFAPTGVAELDGLYYVTTGYSLLDYVLTARILKLRPLTIAWSDLAFGGRGDGPGQFNTAHAVQVHPGTTQLDIADRMHSKVDRFTRHGQYLSSLRLPAGALPCDIHYCGGYAIIPCLDGPDRNKSAPIYILENGKIISQIFPKDDLGLVNFKHVHNAVLRKIGGRFYIITQAWNPGDFAILEQVDD